MRDRLVDYWNWRNRISYAPPGEGGDGGEGEGADTTQAGEGDDTLEGGESKEEDELNVDGLDALNKLFAGNEEEGEEEDDSGPEILTADQVKTFLDEGIAKVAIPDSMIPTDFDPRDRKQMAKLLSDASQFQIKHALNLMFRPVENAMRSHAKEVRTDVRSRIGRVTEGTSTEKFLAREIPASQNPKHAALVKTIWTNAIAQHPKPEDRAKAVTLAKSGLKAMNINYDDAGTSPGQKGETGGNLRTGTAALDLYAPKPKAASTATSLRK